jgi:hemerythrin-like domain-containing protein
MKRHLAIQPLSRQHHTALLAVLLLKKGIDRQADPLVMRSFLQQVWDQQLQPHFDAEEQFLLPLIQTGLPTVASEILAQHAQLWSLYRSVLANASADNLQAFVQLLEAHIRKEERQYFPAIEASLDEAALAQLASQLPEEKKATCLQFAPRFWE